MGNQRYSMSRHIMGVLQKYVELGLMIRGNQDCRKNYHKKVPKGKGVKNCIQEYSIRQKLNK